VVATGSYHGPNRPAFAPDLPTELLQLDANEYRNARALPPGAVLVVGSGQSGAQIAEELHECGRRVYLAVGSAGRRPRRYRGKDLHWWIRQMSIAAGRRTVDQLPSRRLRFEPSPHLSGTKGGHEINLRHLGRDGIVLLGHLRGAEGDRLVFAPDLEDSLRRADEEAAKFKRDVDRFISEAGLVAPPEAPEPAANAAAPGQLAAPILDLDIAEAGIRTLIWATGYRPDFGWIRLPILDEDGYPIHRRGVTDYPGLYFLGLRWLYTRRSSLLGGVGEDAAYLASAMARAAGGVVESVTVSALSHLVIR
jgi:putative flavoprotein involved in K+ transport